MASLFGRQAATQPASAAAAPVAANSAAPDTFFDRIPWFSCLILLVLVAMFWAELGYPVEPSTSGTPSIRTLTALGALSHDLVAHSGEWWRLFTAPLLHASYPHIIGNGIVLLIAGWMLEPMIGRSWFALIYFVGGLGGAIYSMNANSDTMITVGASGAIMGVLTAVFVCSFHRGLTGFRRWELRLISLRLIVPSLLPALASGDTTVDYSAHMGGALAGCVMGLVLQFMWPAGHERPHDRKFAGWTAAGLFIVSLVSIFMMTRHYPVYAARAATQIPMISIPKNAVAGEKISDRLIQKYPADPRAHFYRAVWFFDHNAPADAEQQLRIAVQQASAPDSDVDYDFLQNLRVLLAADLVEEGKPDQAKPFAAPACQWLTGQKQMAALDKELTQARACP